MTTNAYRTLRICLAAAAMLLFLTHWGYPAKTHVVQKGETLYGIAKQYGTTVKILQEANGLQTTHIKHGEVLTISLSDPQPESTTYGRSENDNLKVTSGDQVVATLDKGDRFMILERDGDTYKVKLEDGRMGTVSADDIEIEETRKPLPVSDSYAFRRDVVRTALAYRGARYRRGGVSSRGFDCSGFTMHVYAQKGVKLPHSSSAQFKYGKAVSKSDLQPGDLVFFSNTYRKGISHVGLYVGGGKFIHASTSSRGVRVDDLDSDYYRRRYAGARRIKT